MNAKIESMLRYFEGLREAKGEHPPVDDQGYVIAKDMVAKILILSKRLYGDKQNASGPPLKNNNMLTGLHLYGDVVNRFIKKKMSSAKPLRLPPKSGSPSARSTRKSREKEFKGAHVWEWVPARDQALMYLAIINVVQHVVNGKTDVQSLKGLNSAFLGTDIKKVNGVWSDSAINFYEQAFKKLKAFHRKMEVDSNGPKQFEEDIFYPLIGPPSDSDDEDDDESSDKETEFEW